MAKKGTLMMRHTSPSGEKNALNFIFHKFDIRELWVTRANSNKVIEVREEKVYSTSRWVFQIYRTEYWSTNIMYIEPNKDLW